MTNICSSCEKNLGGHSMFCPENNTLMKSSYKKWNECVCFVHTCYDAKAIRAKSKSLGTEEK